LTFLVVGFDGSPANTDVLSVISYDSGANTVHALQIPRDTYISYGDKSGKINGYYSYETLVGKTHKQALSSLSYKISESLGVSIDGYFALTEEGFCELVDFVDGVDVAITDVPKELTADFKAREDKVHLSGKDAMTFVRYRRDYVRADLDRLDAQKVFMKALFSKICERKELFSLVRFINNSENIYCDINTERSFSFLLGKVFRTEIPDLQIATLPGVARKIDKSWYYIVKKEEAKALIKGYFPYETREFDEKNNFIYKL